MKHLNGLNVLVLGLGDSGLAMARWSARCGAHVRVADTREAPPQLDALKQHVPDAEFASGAFTTAFLAVAVAAMDAVPLLGLGMVFFLVVAAGLLTVFFVWQAWRGRWFVLPLLGDMALEIVNRRRGR